MSMKGKIIKGIAGFYYVYVEDFGILECKAKGAFRKNKIKPMIGDDVRVVLTDPVDFEGNIEEILPRKNELIRPAVANIDQALVIFAAATPEPNFNLLDRFLVMMEYQDIPVKICFNKMDLVDEAKIDEMMKPYRDAGYEVHAISAKEEEGIEEIQTILRGKISTVAGPSGVGKSSMINRLQSATVMETGGISKKLHRGKHTTRHSQLIPLADAGNQQNVSEVQQEVDTPQNGSVSQENNMPQNGSVSQENNMPQNGTVSQESGFRVNAHFAEEDASLWLPGQEARGFIMDTPGFSSLFVPEFEKEDLGMYYPEFEPYLGQCLLSPCIQRLRTVSSAAEGT